MVITWLFFTFKVSMSEIRSAVYFEHPEMNSHT